MRRLQQKRGEVSEDPVGHHRITVARQCRKPGKRTQRHRVGGGKDRPKESNAPAPDTHLLNPGVEPLPVTYRLHLLALGMQKTCMYALAPPNAWRGWSQDPDPVVECLTGPAGSLMDSTSIL